MEVRVTDSGGLSDTQSFTVTVDDVNEAPSITSTPVQEQPRVSPTAMTWKRPIRMQAIR